MEPVRLQVKGHKKAIVVPNVTLNSFITEENAFLMFFFNFSFMFKLGFSLFA